MAPSSYPHEDEVPPLGQSHVISQPDALRVPSTSEIRSEDNIDTVESPRGRSTLKKWRQRMGIKDLGLHKSGRLSRKSCEPVDPPARVDDRQEGPSTMAVSTFLDGQSNAVCSTYLRLRATKSLNGERFVVP